MYDTNFLPLMIDTFKITENFTFLDFQRFICILCTPEGRMYGLILHSSSKFCCINIHELYPSSLNPCKTCIANDLCCGLWNYKKKHPHQWQHGCLSIYTARPYPSAAGWCHDSDNNVLHLSLFFFSVFNGRSLTNIPEHNAIYFIRHCPF